LIYTDSTRNDFKDKKKDTQERLHYTKGVVKERTPRSKTRQKRSPYCERAHKGTIIKIEEKKHEKTPLQEKNLK
jgi:hypothetical protein